VEIRLVAQGGNCIQSNTASIEEVKMEPTDKRFTEELGRRKNGDRRTRGIEGNGRQMFARC
jgi:hypothetical protein